MISFVSEWFWGDKVRSIAVIKGNIVTPSQGRIASSADNAAARVPSSWPEVALAFNSDSTQNSDKPNINSSGAGVNPLNEEAMRPGKKSFVKKRRKVCYVSADHLISEKSLQKNHRMDLALAWRASGTAEEAFLNRWNKQTMICFAPRSVKLNFKVI